jgi:hypothetical protein
MSRIQFWHSGEVNADQSRRVLAHEQYTLTQKVIVREFMFEMHTMTILDKL